MRNAHMVGGVSFHGGKIQAAAIEEQSTDSFLQSVREIDYDLPDDAWMNPSQIPDATAKITDALSSAFDAQAVPQKISVALPSEATLLLTAPIDSTLDPRALREHIDWELINYHKGQEPQELVSSHVSLEKFGDKQTTEILIVAIRRSTLQMLRTACDRLGTQLLIVDIEHFCVESVLAKNHLNARTQNVLLIGNKKNRTQVSLVAQSQLRRYRYGNGATDLQKVEFIKDFIGECHEANVAFQAVFLYGDALENFAFTLLQSRAGIPIEYVDPDCIWALQSSPQSPDIQDGTLHPSRFAPCIGVAMRTA
ncbi:MAG: hypothetical protein ACE5H0_01875 [Bacteroidota bacterium]